MTRELVTIGEHTLDTNMLTSGGWVLDAGCRDFMFAKGVAERGCRVFAIDADATIQDPAIEGVAFYHEALWTHCGEVNLVMTTDAQARHIMGSAGPQGGSTAKVRAVTLASILKFIGIERFEAIKLDIEGAEYDILYNFPGPIAKQLSIEFHEHVRPRSPLIYEAIFNRLEGFGYEIIQHKKESRYCCAPNFWDTLLVLKEST